MKFFNLIISVLSTIFSIFIIYLILIFYNFSDFKQKENKFFQSLEISEFHKKYSLELHHTRGDDWGIIYNLLIENHNLKSEDLYKDSDKKVSSNYQILFNYIHKTKSKNTILFQGDLSLNCAQKWLLQL